MSKSTIITSCDRCTKEIDLSRWENHTLGGKINLDFPAQAFGALCGMKHTADQEHFEAWRRGHPAATKNEARHVTFEWPNENYRLCYDCQKRLLGIVGLFFRYGNASEKQKAFLVCSVNGSVVACFDSMEKAEKFTGSSSAYIKQINIL